VTATARAVELARIAAEAAAEKLASDIIAYDVSEQLVITDVFLLCSAANDRQIRAIVDEIEERVYYALERLWKDCPRVPLAEPVGVVPGGPSATSGPDGDVQ